MNPERNHAKLQPLKVCAPGVNLVSDTLRAKRKVEAWVTKRFPFVSALGFAIQLAASDAAGALGTGMTA